MKDVLDSGVSGVYPSFVSLMVFNVDVLNL